MAKPGDTFGFQFKVQGSTGALVAADSLPTGMMVRKGVDDSAITIATTAITGIYYASGTIPSGYAIDDFIQIRISATVGGVVAAYFESLGYLSTNVVTLAAAQPNYAPSKAGDQMALTPATRVTLAASQPDYAPAKAGDAMTLTAAVRVLLAAVQTDYAPSKAGDAMTLTGTSRVVLAASQPDYVVPNAVLAASQPNYAPAKAGDQMALTAATRVVLNAVQPDYAPSKAGDQMALVSAARIILAASQPDYAPSKTGDAMTLTAGERTATANEVENQIIDDTDSEKVLKAITDKIAAANPSLAGLTLSSIAAAVLAAFGSRLGSMTPDEFWGSTNPNFSLHASGTAGYLLKSTNDLSVTNFPLIITPLTTISGLQTTISANIGSINGNISTINGNVANLSTNLGSINTSLSTINGGLGTISTQLTDIRDTEDTIIDDLGTPSSGSDAILNSMVSEITPGVFAFTASSLSQTPIIPGGPMNPTGHDYLLIPTDGYTGSIGGVIWNNLNQVFNRTLLNFELWDDDSISDYEITASQQGTSSIYSCILPELPSSLRQYTFIYFGKAGPALSLDDVRNRILGLVEKANGALQTVSVSSTGTTEVLINDH